jgi:hypothetical protein
MLRAGPRRVKHPGGPTSPTRPVAVRFAADEAPLLKQLQARAAAQDRSLSGQLKHYARLALIAEDNPDLPLSMIQGILEAR